MNLVGYKKRLLALVAAVEVVGMGEELFQERGRLMKFRRWVRDGEGAKIAERNYRRESAMNQCRRERYRLCRAVKVKRSKNSPRRRSKKTVLRHRNSLSDRTDHAAMDRIGRVSLRFCSVFERSAICSDVRSRAQSGPILTRLAMQVLLVLRRLDWLKAMASLLLRRIQRICRLMYD